MVITFSLEMFQFTLQLFNLGPVLLLTLFNLYNTFKAMEGVCYGQIKNGCLGKKKSVFQVT